MEVKLKDSTVKALNYLHYIYLDITDDELVNFIVQKLWAQRYELIQKIKGARECR